MRTIYIDEEINGKLKIEDNASGLIEELLRQHYDLKVLEEHAPSPEQISEQEIELQKKAEDLNLQVEELKKKKEEAVDYGEIKKKLDKLGVTNAFLIDRLKKQKNYPSVDSVKQIKEDYHIKLGDQIWKAWRILHPEAE